MSKADTENQAMRHAHGLAEVSSKVLIIDSGKDHIRVDHGAVHLCTDRKGIGHDVVYDARVSLREAVYRSHRCLIYDRWRAAGDRDLVPYVLGDFRVGKPCKVIVDGDTLTQRLMDGLAESAVQVGFPTEDQRKTVEGIVTVIHEHLDVVEDGGIQELRLIHGEDQGLAFFPVEVFDLFLDRPEPPGFSASEAHAENLAQFTVEFGDTYGREADVLHMVLAGHEGLRETPQTESLPHARPGSKDTDPADVLEMQEAAVHLFEIR